MTTKDQTDVELSEIKSRFRGETMMFEDKNKKCKKLIPVVSLVCVVIVVILLLVLVIAILVVVPGLSPWKDLKPDLRSTLSEITSLEKSSGLLEPMTMGQSGVGGGPLSKYYLNVGLRQDYLLQECQGSHWKRSFPDIDYALMGYDILKGYPLAVGHDPGFTLPIFSADYSAGRQTADCRYSVPEGVILIPDVSCVTSFSSSVIETAYEFSQSLSVSAHVSGGGWGVSFSASAGYKESSSVMATGQSVFILSTANCNYYYMKLLTSKPPPFHPVFIAWIQKLNAAMKLSDKQQQEDIFIEFFETYGTHFLREVKFGASFTYIHKMSSSSYKTQTEKGVNVAVQASYSGLFSVGGGFNMDSSQREAASNFQKSVETKTITVGAAPPANGDAMTWASTVKESPIPVRYSLDSIENLFTEEFMSSNMLSGIQYEDISAKITETKLKYCEVLFAEGLLDSCSQLSPGLAIDGFGMYGWFDRVHATSNAKCVDECHKRLGCVAVDYCNECTEDHYDYNVCFLHDEDGDSNAVENEKYVSTIVTDQIEEQFIMQNTAVKGVQRGGDESRKINTEKACFAKCLSDVNCVAFTFCTCPDKHDKCLMFSDAGISFVAEVGTTTHFISRRVRNVSDVYPDRR